MGCFDCSQIRSKESNSLGTQSLGDVDAVGALSHSGSKDETDGQRMILCNIERETSSVWKGQVCVQREKAAFGCGCLEQGDERGGARAW